MAEIDRILKEPSDYFDGKLLVILIAAVIVISLITSILNTPSTLDNNPPASNHSARIKYASHANILIDGNSGFLALNTTTGITNGSGTALDPYIIEGWNISASSSTGIEIENTDAWVIIRDSNLHDGISNDGMILINVSNIQIVNCTFLNNWDDIYCSLAKNMTVLESIFSLSTNNGIISSSSSRIRLERNWFNTNGRAISLSSSVNVILNNNTFTPYWEGAEILSVNNLTITNNSCSGVRSLGGVGFELTSCTNVSFTGNNVSSNLNDAIVFSTSHNGNFSDNKISSNGARGIVMFGSDNVSVIGNEIINNDDGVWISTSSNISIIGNNISSNAGSAIHCYNSDNNQYSNNTLFMNSRGIGIYNSRNQTCNNNNISMNEVGIQCQNSTSTIIIFNYIAFSSMTGIILEFSSNHNLISNNTCNSNNLNGLDLYSSCNENVICNNTFNFNNKYGIYLNSSGDNEIAWNTICNNTKFGLRIDVGSNDNEIWNNTFIGNNGAASTRDPAHLQAFDGGTNNRWNTSGSPHGYGNYWSDWTIPDADFNGIVDKPYNLTAGVGPMDHYPRTTPALPIPEFSESVIPIIGLMLIALMIRKTRTKP